MHSNLVTPPDFVDDKLHTVTVVNASKLEVEALARMCEHTDEFYNIYLYRSDMEDAEWLQKAVDISDAVIVNTDINDHKNLCALDKTYYYGSQLFLENPKKIVEPLHYFAARVKSTK